MFLLNYIYRRFTLKLVRALVQEELKGGGGGLSGGVLVSERALGQ